MQILRYVILAAFLLSVNATIAGQEHEHDQGSGHANNHADHQEKNDGKTIHIASAMANRAGITTALAGPGAIQRTLITYGRITISPEQVSHIRARFPGLVISVEVKIGDLVKVGDVLAEVESNESLQKYVIRAPMAGVITERHANVGEYTQDQSLFVISDFNPLWAELKIFPGQRQQVSAGQNVFLSTENLSQKTTLRHILPGNDTHPTVVARAEINNDDKKWTPGLLVEGKIVVESAEVPLVVDNRALQTFRDQTVVFIQDGNTYEARPLELGRSDDDSTEVLSGLNVGDRYVVENSYLIKADIEKSGASHAH